MMFIIVPNAAVILLSVIGMISFTYFSLHSDEGRITPSNRSTNERRLRGVDSYTTINSPIKNKVSYIYVVGVEGTGHHGVTPVIASIAKTCNYQVVYENKELRAALSTRLPMRFNSLLNFYKRKPIAGVDKVLVLEDGSLPTDKLFRNSTMEQKKSTAKYDIEWIYDRTHDMDVNVRFLHLSRVGPFPFRIHKVLHIPCMF